VLHAVHLVLGQPVPIGNIRAHMCANGHAACWHMEHLLIYFFMHKKGDPRSIDTKHALDGHVSLFLRYEMCIAWAHLPSPKIRDARAIVPSRLPMELWCLSAAMLSRVFDLVFCKDTIQ
jgi:hypothetical protein